VLRVGYSTGLGGLLKPQRSGLCRTLDMDFREFPFHALR